MPRPNKGESEKSFVSRYMSHPESNKKYPDAKQRAAVAYSVFQENKVKKASSPLAIDPAGNLFLK